MDWDKLRIFKAVAEAGSFTHAGETLGLSQSATSRQISGLEKSLGLALFHRHARGLILTEQGEILFGTTKDVFKRLDDVETQLGDSSDLAEGSINLTTVEFIASTWLVPQIPNFRSLYPKIQLTLLLDNRIYDLNKREADVAIRLYKTDDQDLIEQHLSTIEFSLCASKQYLKNNGAPKTPADFKKHIMIAYPPNAHAPFSKPNWTLKKLNIDLDDNPNILFINSMHARYSAIKSGAGISILPKYIIEQDDGIETIMPNFEIPNVAMYLVYPRSRSNSTRIKVLKDFLFNKINNETP